MAAACLWKRPWKETAFGPLSFLSGRMLNPEANLGKRLLRQRVSFASNLFRQDLKAHYGCVNAIEFSTNGGQFIISGGDDRRVLLWNMQKAMMRVGQPISMKGEHSSNIFCLAFDQNNSKIFSGGNDEQVIVHDIKTCETLDVFRHEDAVYGLSVDPNNENVFASACDDGRILIYDIREPADSEPFCLANYTSSMHAVMYNPVEPRLLATANAREGVGLWDVRKPGTCLLRYGGNFTQQSCMSVRINQLGTRIIALRRRLPPVLYNIENEQPACEFDHNGYYNSCTMKSCSFAGDSDQYVLSGSDDFNLYMWKIPEDLSFRQHVSEAHMVLKGHRSIVNQVRYNVENSLIVSSGVEKIIKIWSPYPMPDCEGGITKGQTTSLSERPVYTPEEYINLVLRSGHIMSHDYSHQSTEEDPRMMAFFDSLVQGELEYWSSDDDLSSNEEELYDHIMQVSRSEPLPLLTENLEENQSSDISDDESDFSPFTLAFASVMAAQTAEGSSSHSRLLEAQEEASQFDSDENGQGELHGQRPRTQRKSISEIIAMNRKETLKTVESRQKSNAKMKKSASRTEAPAATTSSSDSDSDGEGPSAAKKFRKISSESEDTDLGLHENKKPLEEQKVKCHLKRLRDLRNRALNSDSESGECDLAVPTKKAKFEKQNSFGEFDPCIPGTSQSDSLNLEEKKVVLSMANLNNHKDSGGPGLGPYLQEGDLNHNSARSGGVGVVGGCSERTGISNNDAKSGTNSNINECHCGLQSSEKGKKVSNLNLVNSKKKTVATSLSIDNAPCGDLNSNCTFPSTSRDENSNDSAHPQNKAKDSVKNDEHDSHGNQEIEDNNEPVWTEFKRFKHRLERARRYYRQHSNSGHQSSDDEDE